LHFHSFELPKNLGTAKRRRSIEYKEDRMPFLSKTCTDYTMERRTHTEHIKGDPETVKTHESLPLKFEKS
jgi:hypothetical protein